MFVLLEIDALIKLPRLLIVLTFLLFSPNLPLLFFQCLQGVQKMELKICTRIVVDGVLFKLGTAINNYGIIQLMVFCTRVVVDGVS
jgi:hypothetical protein